MGGAVVGSFCSARLLVPRICPRLVAYLCRQVLNLWQISLPARVSATELCWSASVGAKVCERSVFVGSLQIDVKTSDF